MAIGTPVVALPDQRTSAGTTSTPAYPSPINAGDLLILWGISGATANNVFDNAGTLAAAGWTIDAQISNTGNTAAPEVFLAHIYATGSETGNLTVPHTSVITSCGLIAVPGVDQTTALDVAVVTTDKTTASTTISIGTRTIVTAGAMGIMVASGNSTTITATPPSGWTSALTHAASARSGMVAYKGGFGAGATGTISAAPGWSGSSKDVVIGIYLRPASTSSPVSVTGTVSDLTIAAPAGGVSTQTQISLTGVAAALTIAALAGSVAVQQNVSLTGTLSNVALSAPAGSIATQRQVSLTGAVGTLVFGAPAGSISTGGNVNLTGTVSALTITAPAGTVSVQRQISLAGAVANVSLVAPAGAVATVRSVALTGATSSLVLSGPAGTVTTPAVSLGLPELVKAQVILRSADAEVIPRAVRAQPATRAVGAPKIARTVRAQPITRTVEEST